MYKLDFLDREYKVEAFRTSYLKNNTLAVMVENKDIQECLTVNLNTTLTDKNCAYVDTNNVKWAENFLQENKIAHPTGRCAISGFCTYPEYRFDMSKLKDYETENNGNGNDMEM